MVMGSSYRVRPASRPGAESGVTGITFGRISDPMTIEEAELMGQPNPGRIETTSDALARASAAKRRDRRADGARQDSIPCWWRNARR
jgi:hypothetical protein